MSGAGATPVRGETQTPALLKAAGGVLVALTVGAIVVNILARWFGWPIFGASTVAQYALTLLAFTAFAHASQSPMLNERGRIPRQVREIGLGCVAGFASATFVIGAFTAAFRVGGWEPVLGLPNGLIYGACAGVAAFAVMWSALRGGVFAIGLVVGGAAAFATPELPVWLVALAFFAALSLGAPVAFALIGAVALAPTLLSPSAMSQSMVQWLSPGVLLAIPLFILAAGLLIEAGLADKVIAAARRLAGHRGSALGEANVVASLFFGGMSGSSIADAGLGGKLLVPPMVASGYSPRRAVALTAAAATLPNIMPPSIALLIAAAATDQSVAALWLGGVGAAVCLMALLWGAARLTPGEAVPVSSRSGDAKALAGFALILGVTALVLVAMRAGWVTATEAGVLVVLLAGSFCVAVRGPRGLWCALTQCGVETARIALLIAAAGPVTFVMATSGWLDRTFLPADAGLLTAAVAVLICLFVGTVLDAGAAILLVLPVLLVQVVAAGFDSVQATIGLTIALLLGGLTPPVGVLLLTVENVTGIRGGALAIWPYLLVLIIGVALVFLVPALTTALPRLL